MLKIKTSKLTGAALDLAVAKCEGFTFEYEHDNNDFWLECTNHKYPQLSPFGYLKEVFHFSTDWAQGGPIIERLRFDRITLNVSNNYTASIKKTTRCIELDGDEVFKTAWIHGTGETPLIAAMRCYVASKLGDEVEIPRELTQC